MLKRLQSHFPSIQLSSSLPPTPIGGKNYYKHRQVLRTNIKVFFDEQTEFVAKEVVTFLVEHGCTFRYDLSSYTPKRFILQLEGIKIPKCKQMRKEVIKIPKCKQMRKEGINILTYMKN